MKLTITDKTLYEQTLEKNAEAKNTNVNITPGVSIVYTIEIPEPLKTTGRRKA